MSRILVVDDVALIREPIAAALSSHGFEASCAAGGEEALASVSGSPPDLILLDLSMPRCDGIAVLEALRGDPRHAAIPVILLTEVTDKDRILRAGRLGVRDCLLKSQFSLDQLVERIRNRLAAESPAPAPTAPDPSTAEGEPIASPAPPAAAAPTNSAQALRSLRPIVTPSQIEAHVNRCGEIKALSPAVTQLLKITSSQNCSIDQVVRAVRQDQALSLKLLKLANSVVYTRGEAVDSVHKAVMRIGMSQIRQAALNISVIERFSLAGLGERLSGVAFWEHSIAVGLIAAELVHAREGTVEEADHAFTAGLLHDVGRMAYAQEIPELYGRVLDTALGMQLPLEQVESRMLLINHADMMEKLLTAWRLPRQLICPIAMHHLSMGTVRQVAPNAVTEVGTLVLANALAHALLLGSSGNEAVYPTEDLIKGLGVPPSVIARVVAKIPDQTQDIKLTMLSNAMSQSGAKPLAQRLRERLGVPVRPLVISAEPEIDGLSIFAAALRDPTDEAAPNLILAHVAHPRERVSLTERARQEEARTGAADLPVLVVSSNAGIGLEELSDGRASERLPRPFTLERFAGAASRLLRQREPDHPAPASAGAQPAPAA